MKIFDLILKIIIVIGLTFICFMFYAAFKESELKDVFDIKCRDANGIPLRATYHYDAKQNRIEYTCLKVNAIIDIE